MNAALVCIAKDEDHYIGEWIRYHLKLGFSRIFVYQNNWRYAGDKAAYGNGVEWIEFDGQAVQNAAYNDFISRRHDNFNFAAFFDCDEFLRLPPGTALDSFLARFLNVGGIAVNWRLFGDSGLSFDGIEYSVLKRFTKCQNLLNRHVKTILNMNIAGNCAHFVNPHCVDASFCRDFISDTSGTRYVRGPWNDSPIDIGIWLNHYFCKTIDEYRRIKMPRGKADTPAGHPLYMRKLEEYQNHNFNDITDTAARDFMNS